LPCFPTIFFPSHKWGLHLSIVCVPTTTRTKKNFEEHTGAGARARAFELLLLLTLSLALVAVFLFSPPRLAIQTKHSRPWFT
jgi:hypothetical protein